MKMMIMRCVVETQRNMCEKENLFIRMYQLAVQQNYEWKRNIRKSVNDFVCMKIYYPMKGEKFRVTYY